MKINKMNDLFKNFIKDAINATHLWNNVETKPVFNETDIHYEGCITVVFMEECDKCSKLFAKHIPQDIGSEMFTVKSDKHFEDNRSLSNNILTRKEFKKRVLACQKDRKIVIISIRDRAEIPFRLNFDILINLTNQEKRQKIFGKMYITDPDEFTCKSAKTQVLPYIHIENENNFLKFYIIKRFFVTCALNKVGTESYIKIVKSIKTESLVVNKRKLDDNDGVLYTVIKKMRNFVHF